MMEAQGLSPIIIVQGFVAVNRRVRNWPPVPWGEWRPADLWLERSEAADGGAAGARR